MMESEETTSKKRKFDDLDPIFESFLKQHVKVEWLYSGLAALNYGLEGCKIRTLKIIDANARRPVSFTRASIYFGNDYKTYSMGRVFSNAHSMLNNYLKSDPKTGCLNLPKDMDSRKSLGLLLHYLNNSEKEMKVLSESSSSPEEWCWTLKLAQHVFSKLSLNPKYLYDISKTFDTDVGCPCLEHDKLVGEKGDTSFGWEDGWHGRIDIVMGDVPVYSFGDDDTASSSQFSSPVSSEHLFVETTSSIGREVKKKKISHILSIAKLLQKQLPFPFEEQK